MKRVINKIEEAMNALEILRRGNAENPMPLIVLVERATRMEINKYVADFFANQNLIEGLLDVANLYKDDEKIMEKVLWSLAQISERGFWAIRQYKCDYDFEKISPKIYSIFQCHIYSKNDIIRLASLVGILELPELNEDPKKWEYIVSLSNIQPKNTAIRLFRIYVDRNIECVPDNLKNSISKILSDYIVEKNLDVTSKKVYLDTIDKLK